MKWRSTLFAAAVCACMPFAWAGETVEEAVGKTATHNRHDEFVQHLHEQEAGSAAKQTAAPVPDTAAPTSKPTLLRDDDLLAQPQLLTMLLQQALNSNNPDLIDSLAALYRRLPDADALLIGRADGTLRYLRGQLTQAIAAYSALHREYPDDARVGLDLAAMQFDNRQWADAEQSFAHLAARQDLPAAVQRNVQAYQTQLAGVRRWQWTAGISPIHNSNVNDAPLPHCTTLGCSPKAEPAWGVDYRSAVSKLTPIQGNHALLFKANLSGTSYYLSEKSQYDYASARAYTGWQWQNGRNTLTLLPLYQMQFAGSDDFDDKPTETKRILPFVSSHAWGIQASAARALSPRWQAYGSLEAYRISYRERARERRNGGWQSSLFASISYRATPTTTLSVNVQHSRLTPHRRTLRNRPNSAEYHRNRIGAGWQQIWTGLGNLESSASLSYSQTHYRGIAPMGNDAQRNREISAALTLSHPKIAFAGFEPSLNLQYSRTYSNRPWAERRRVQMFVEAEKRF